MYVFVFLLCWVFIAASRGYSVVVARRLLTAVTSLVVCKLICSMACGILPKQGSNPCPLHWQGES